MFYLFIPTIFLTCYFGIKQFYFTLFALAKVSDISPLKGDTLHNGIIQAVTGGLAPHALWTPVLLLLLLSLVSNLTFYNFSSFN